MQVPSGLRKCVLGICCTILEAAGTDFEHAFKTTCFLADIGDFAAFKKVYVKYFIFKPARSCVAVRELPKGVLCEIEATAVQSFAGLFASQKTLFASKWSVFCQLHRKSPRTNEPNQ